MLFSSAPEDLSTFAYPGGVLSVQALLDAMPDGYFLLGPGLTLLASNAKVYVLLGRHNPGATHFSAVFPNLVAVFSATLRESLERRKPMTLEACLAETGGWIELRATPHEGLLHVHLRDVTLRKRHEEELKRYATDLLSSKLAFERQAEELAATNRALEESRLVAEASRAQSETERASAEAANQAKSSFLANMSHEIRTPITAIVGYAEMMLEPGLSAEDRRTSLSSIRRNARHLLELINDILDLSKIEAGKMACERLETDLARLVAEVVSLMRPRALESNLDFQLHFDGPVRKIIQTDPLRVRQILVNLIGNAIKFTPSGLVMLRITCLAHTPGRAAAIRFDVMDTGIGIQHDQQERLFESFVQADGSTTRRFGGTGLGLSISKRLAHVLGGDIVVASEPGQGSTFSLIIDAGDCNDDVLLNVNEAIVPQTAAVTANVLPQCRILVVEDGRDNQVLICATLERAGATVTVADNGDLALTAVEDAVRSGAPFDLILMDMQMPVLDGYGASSELRRRGVTTPIVALTAHAMSDDRTKCMSAGCSEYLSKPVDRRTMIDTLLRLLEPGTVQSPASPPARGLVSELENDEVIGDLVERFVTSLPESVATMLATRAAGNHSELLRRVHQLKGAGGGFGFPRITEVAAVAESALRAGDSLASGRVDALIDLCRSVAGYRANAEIPAPQPLRQSA